MPILSRRHISLALLVLTALPCARGQSRPLMLASSWPEGLAPADYWVSEKLDGMRGRWDGQALWSRGGHRIPAPAWFTADWPRQALDGELWAGRGTFEQVVSTARQHQPSDEAWRSLRFMAFDLPQHKGPFGERVQALRTLLEPLDIAWLQAIEQQRLSSAAQLRKLLAQVVSEGGEGLMLHHDQALYQSGRSKQLLKLKVEDDAEARVIAHLPGKGELAGKLGALEVEMAADGTHGARRFRLCSGLTDREREHPPPIGAQLSFRYRGLTASGLPRFATFWRIRPEE